MAIIQTGVASGSVGGNLLIDPTFQTARNSDHPPEILGAYSLSQVSGNLTLAAAGTIATPVPVFSFRWAPANSTLLCMVRRIEVGFNTSAVAFTTAQSLQYNLIMARTYTVAATGGTGMTTAQSNTWKQRTIMPPSAFTGGPSNIMISNTTALTTGTVTYDSQYMATVNGTVSTIGTSIPMQTLFQQQTGDYPLILAANEGFIINNGQVMGAGGSGNLIVNVEWMELAATTGNNIAY
jgi:hypothetical protein